MARYEPTHVIEKGFEGSPTTVEILVNGREGKCKLRLVCGTGYHGAITVGIILEFARHLCVDIVDKSLDTIEGTVVGPVLVTIRSFVVIQIGSSLQRLLQLYLKKHILSCS